jgi:uncharacterized membrane protein
MRSILNFMGILLIIVGIAALAYQGFTYTKKEKIVEIGSIEVTADTQKTVYLSPIFGALSLVGGIVLVVLGRKK